MGRLVDLTGRVFGYLTVVERTFTSNKSRNAMWKCLCVCGKEHAASGGNLQTGNIRSCGCKTAELFSESSRKRPYESLYNQFLSTARDNNREVDLSYECFVSFTATDECEYCGGPVCWSAYNVNENGSAYNLDRKDNTKGYTKDNVVVCCTTCNRAKGARYTYQEWACMAGALRQLRQPATGGQPCF